MRARTPPAPVPARKGTLAQAPTPMRVRGLRPRTFPAMSGVPKLYAKAQLSRRKRVADGEDAAMARRRKKRTLKPRLPARVRTKRRKGKQKSEQRPEPVGRGLVVGGTGTTRSGVLALLGGTLLLSGASAGALVRRSGHAVRRAHTKARRARPIVQAEPAPVIPLRAPEPPVDAVHDFPDVVG